MFSRRLADSSSPPLPRQLWRGGCLLARLLALFLAAFLTGCIILPIPTGDKKVLAGSRVSKDTLGRLQVGVTTRKEATDLIGPPLFWWEDQNIVGYQWDVRKMWILWGVGGYGGGAAGIHEVPRHHMLLIQFDGADRVSRIGSTVRRGGEHLGDHLVEWWNQQSAEGTKTMLAPDAVSLPRARVMFRVVGLVNGLPIEAATGGKIRGGKRIFGSATLAAALGNFHSAGIPLKCRPEALPGRAGEAGWFELLMQPELNYLAVGPTFLQPPFPPPASVLGVTFRLEVPSDAPLVYAGSVYIPCQTNKLHWTRYVSGVRKQGVEIRDESDQLAGILELSGAGRSRALTRLMVVQEGVPRLRTPQGAVRTVP